MKNILSVVLLIVVVISSSCNDVEKKQAKEKQITIVELLKKTEVPLKTNGHNIIPFPISYSMQNDTNYLAFEKKQNKGIVVFNLKTGDFIKEVPIKIFDRQRIFAFNYYSPDSIFIAFHAGYVSSAYFHDSSMVVINDKGDLKKVLNFKKSFIRCSYNDITLSDNDLSLTAPAAFSNILYSDNKLFMSLSKYSHFNEDDTKLPIAGHYDFLTNKFISYDTLLGMPFVEKGKFYYRPHNPFITLSHRNLPLISFNYTPLVYNYNYKTKKYSKLYIKSMLVDTITFEKSRDSLEQKIKYKSSYLGFYYDIYKKQYYRFAELAAKKTDSPYRKNHKKVSIIVIDTSFNVVAEGIIPENLDFMQPVITKEGIWFRNTEKSKSRYTYELYSLNLHSANMSELIKQYNEEKKINNKNGIVQYISDVFKKDVKNSSIVVVPFEYGCKACATSAVKFYKDNKQLFVDNNIFIVIAGITPNAVDEFIEKNELNKDMPNLLIDRFEKYLSYIDEFNNPKLFVLEKGKITFQKVYKPAELIKLQMKIKNLTKK